MGSDRLFVFCLGALAIAGGALFLLLGIAALDAILRTGDAGWQTPAWVDRCVVLLLAVGLTSLVAALAAVAGALWLAFVKGGAL